MNVSIQLKLKLCFKYCKFEINLLLHKLKKLSIKLHIYKATYKAILFCVN